MSDLPENLGLTKEKKWLSWKEEEGMIPGRDEGNSQLMKRIKQMVEADISA